MNKKQKGFAVLESLLIIVIIAIAAGTGYYVWHSKSQADKTYNATLTTSSNLIGKSTLAGGYVVATTPVLDFSNWKVSLKLPPSLVDKAVYAYDSPNDEYDLSLKSINQSQQCKSYLQSMMSFPPMAIGRDSSNRKAEGLLFSVAVNPADQNLSLGQYYDKHKMPGSNYIEDEGGTIRFYKVGSYFYSLFGSAFNSKSAADKLSAACNGLTYSFETLYDNAMATLTAD